MAFRPVVFGGSGKLGNRIVHQLAARGHSVTAFVRDEERFRASLEPSIAGRVKVVLGDATNADDVARALKGHNVVINAAGTVVDAASSKTIVANIVEQSEKHLDAPRRVVVTGGLFALLLPRLGIPATDLPNCPAAYKTHTENYEVLAKSTLDWTFLAPGPMNQAADGKANEGVVAFPDVLPIDLSDADVSGPREAILPVLQRSLPRLIVTYDDVGYFVATHLDANGPFSRKRVGFILPPGQTAHKEYPAGTAQAAVLNVKPQ